MFTWLKNKVDQWLSEKFARMYQEVHTQRLEKTMNILPEEFTDIKEKLATLNDNSWANHHLYKKAMNSKKYEEAFLYFFYAFELNLKNLIMSEMVITNNLRAIEGKNENMFLVYSSDQICQIQKMGHVLELIKEFCKLHGNNELKGLSQINTERNFIIHNMMRKKLSEEEIKKAFENFFIKSKDAIIKVYRLFDTILAERPTKMLERIKSFKLVLTSSHKFSINGLFS